MEIGEKVSWSVGDHNFKGLFLENLNNGFIEVVCISMNGNHCGLRVKVEANRIQKVNN